jgi:hypothetical protein
MCDEERKTVRKIYEPEYEKAAWRIKINRKIYLNLQIF